jgi:hypothetical protein
VKSPASAGLFFLGLSNLLWDRLCGAIAPALPRRLRAATDCVGNQRARKPTLEKSEFDPFLPSALCEAAVDFAQKADIGAIGRSRPKAVLISGRTQ